MINRIIRPKLEQYISQVCHMGKSEFAAMINVSPATVSQWLYTTKTPCYHNMYAMCKSLGLAIEELIVLFEVDEVMYG